MLGATASLILGGLGMAANAAQAVKANKEKKAAEAAAKQYADNLKNITETNYMMGLQSPDISSLQQEANARNQQMAIQAMQEMGAAGAAQATGILESGRQADLQTAQQQAVMDQQTQQIGLQTQQGIEQRKAARQTGIEQMGLQGSQLAAYQAQNQKAASLSGLMGSVGTAISGIDGLIGLYGNGQNQQQPLTYQQGQTLENITGQLGMTVGVPGLGLK